MVWRNPLLCCRQVQPQYFNPLMTHVDQRNRSRSFVNVNAFVVPVVRSKEVKRMWNNLMRRLIPLACTIGMLALIATLGCSGSDTTEPSNSVRAGAEVPEE